MIEATQSLELLRDQSDQRSACWEAGSKGPG
jgi:hypothetical protein